MRFFGIVLVAGLSVLLSGCAAAALGRGLVGASLARAIPMSIGRMAVAQAGVMTLRVGADEAGAWALAQESVRWVQAGSLARPREWLVSEERWGQLL